MARMTLSWMDALDRRVESEAAPPPPTSFTLVLVGRTGNGKSATGNSILGRKAFESGNSSSGVTSTSELEWGTRPDGSVVRVVDTPGFFDVSMSQEDIKREVVKCLELAKDGVHSLLLVLSTRNRFTAEEMAVADLLQVLFGDDVLQYVVVVFTGGDELEDEGRSLGDYCADAPDALKDVLHRCGNRTALFNNRATGRRKAAQDGRTEELLSTVADMVRKNGGKPYTNELFREAQILAKKLEEAGAAAAGDGGRGHTSTAGMRSQRMLTEQMELAYAAQMIAMTAMVEERLRMSEQRLEERLTAEQRIRELVEMRTYQSRVESEKSVKDLQLQLCEALKQHTEELRKTRAAQGKQGIWNAIMTACKVAASVAMAFFVAAV